MKRRKAAKNTQQTRQRDTEAEQQMLMSLFEINVIRYALTLEDPRPERLDPFFLVDFMSLPDDYFQQDSILKYGIIISLNINYCLLAF